MFMFDDFSGQGRRAMQLAYRAAHRFQHDYVGADHILLGVVREGSDDIAQVLAAFGVNSDKLLADLEFAMEPGEKPVSSDQLPLTPLAKRVLERARKETQILQHEHLGPAHLLLALLHTNQGLAVNLLHEFGLDYMAAWQAVQKHAPPANRDHQVQPDGLGSRIMRDPTRAELDEELTEDPLPAEMMAPAEEEPMDTAASMWHPAIDATRDSLYRQLRYTQHILGMAVGFLGGYLAYGLRGALIGILCVIAIVAIQSTVVSLIVGFIGGFMVGFFHTGELLWTIIGALSGVLIGGCLGSLWLSRSRRREEDG